MKTLEQYPEEERQEDVSCSLASQAAAVQKEKEGETDENSTVTDGEILGAAAGSLFDNLPVELLRKIAWRLWSPLESIRFASVCRTWRNQSDPMYISGDRSPLLLYWPEDDQDCCYYSPPFNRAFIKRSQCILSEFRLRFAKDGWLILSHSYDTVFLLNPFTHQYFDLPDMDYLRMFDTMAFSCTPTSPECILFGILYWAHLPLVEISTCRRNKPWSPVKNYDNDNSLFRLLVKSNPVFHQGLFYCLGEGGTLGVYDPENDTWTVLDKLGQVLTDKDQGLLVEGFLVEYGGELLAVFAIDGDQGTQVRVFKLNETDMRWEMVTSLGDGALFVGSPMSLAITKAPNKRMANKICFPSFRRTVEVERSYPEIGHKQGSESRMKEDQEDQEEEEGGGGDPSSLYYYSLERKMCHPKPSRLINSITYLNCIWIDTRFDEASTTSTNEF